MHVGMFGKRSPWAAIAALGLNKYESPIWGVNMPWKSIYIPLGIYTPLAQKRCVTQSSGLGALGAEVQAKTGVGCWLRGTWCRNPA